MIVPDGRFCNLCGANQAAAPNLLSVYEQWSKYHFRKISLHTASGYREAWQKLKPLWYVPVNELSYYDFQEVFDSTSVAELSCSYQRKIKILVGLLMRYAICVMNLPAIDVSGHLVYEGRNPVEREILTDEEISKIYSFSKTNWEQAHEARIVMFLICTGLRPNELFSLRPSDVDINQMVILAPGSKTKAGKNRLIPIIAPIRALAIYFYVASKGKEYFILSKGGKKIYLDNWRDRKFYPLMRLLGINLPDNPRRIVPYSCRHTYASLAKRAGVNADILTKMIGHTTVKFTEKTYIHETLPEYRIEADKMGDLLKNIKEKGESYGRHNWSG